MAKSSFFKKLLRREKNGLSGMTITITQDGHSSQGSGSGAGVAGGVDMRSIPLIGLLSVRAQYLVAGGILLASLVGAGLLTYYIDAERSYYGSHLSSITKLKSDLVVLQSDSYKVSLGLDTFISSAYLGQKAVEDGFVFMRSSIFDDMTELKGKAREDLDLAWNEWTGLKESRSRLTDSHIAVLTLRSKFAGVKAPVNEAISNIKLALSMKDESPELMQKLNELNAPMIRFKARVDNGESNVSFGTSAAEVDQMLSQITAALYKVNTEALSDAEVKRKLDGSIKALKELVPSTKKLNAPLANMAEALQKSSILSNGSGRVLQLVDYSEVAIRDELSVNDKLNWLVFLFAGIGLGCIGLLALINNNEGKKRTYEAKNENEANQRAIMSLLDEIANLADGDLTVRATVTEEITGAIADSVNFAITEMATLVNAIKNASGQISEAANAAKSNSMHLLAISDKQSKDIKETGLSVLNITEAIGNVSKRMDDSRRVAESSVESSNRGMQAVNNSIDGIRSIRENVDETGKRIKRLTEQSLQISEIVELIGDISERTSVLAINATVQATKAGVAGKGFKVVADAVQDLANQAADATRRIGALINAIQTDIQGAGAAMQKTTDEALKGAELAETTGEVLAEINDVSMALAEIVAEVNAQIGSSAKSAAEVSLTMKRVLDSVSESTDATKATGAAVEEINKLTEQLRESVSGFQL